jgi:hypothetical protein
MSFGRETVAAAYAADVLDNPSAHTAEDVEWASREVLSWFGSLEGNRSDEQGNEQKKDDFYSFFFHELQLCVGQTTIVPQLVVPSGSRGFPILRGRTIDPSWFGKRSEIGSAASKVPNGSSVVFRLGSRDEVRVTVRTNKEEIAYFFEVFVNAEVMGQIASATAGLYNHDLFENARHVKLTARHVSSNNEHVSENRKANGRDQSFRGGFLEVSIVRAEETIASAEEH